MSEQEIVVKVENLSKTYTPVQSQEQLHGLVKLIQKTKKKIKVDALKNVSFELKRGDCLGIIGSNGAGKSTLLKILSGITSPSSGKITINGRLLSVLDVGTGFHPDLTGRENVYLSGEILGLSKKEIDNIYDGIIAFSGISDFIDIPVKYYSSGMYLRLAFSTITYLSGDILLFDEAISTGDAEFRRKLSDRMQLLRRSGISMIVVSHDINEVLGLCNRLILLENGEVVADGTCQEVAANYLEKSILKSKDIDENSVKIGELSKIGTLGISQREWGSIEDAPGNRFLRVMSASIFSKNKTPLEKVCIDETTILNLKIKKLIVGMCHIGIAIADAKNNPIVAFSSALHDKSEELIKPGDYALHFEIPANIFNTGIFIIELVMFDKGKVGLLREEVLFFKTTYPDCIIDKSLFQQFPGPLRFDVPCDIQHLVIEEGN